jgi:Domain of unknown function (DUF4413)
LYENKIIIAMTNSIKKKFDKYRDQSNIILAKSFFFDPCSKMGLIEFYYFRIYKNDSVSEMIEFSKVLRELYGEYSLKYRVS